MCEIQFKWFPRFRLGENTPLYPPSHCRHLQSCSVGFHQDGSEDQVLIRCQRLFLLASSEHHRSVGFHSCNHLSNTDILTEDSEPRIKALKLRSTNHISFLFLNTEVQKSCENLDKSRLLGVSEIRLEKRTNATGISGFLLSVIKKI